MKQEERIRSDTQSTRTGSLVDALDRVMTATYGARWTGAPKTEEQIIARFNLWAYHLSLLPPDKAKVAISLIPSTFPDVPTPAQVLSLVPRHPSHDTYRRLPHPKADPDVARAHIEQMREKLRR